MNDNYYNKYLKYKFKYIKFMNVLQKSGAITSRYDIIPFADYQTKINFIAWKPDCSALLIVLNTNKYIINLYFFNSNRSINFTGHTNTINSVLWNFKGNKCVSASNDNKAIVWSTKYMKNETELPHSKSVLYAIFIIVEEEIVGTNGATYKKNVEKILTSSSDNRIYLWDIAPTPKYLEFIFNITFIDSSYDVSNNITKYIGLIMNNRVYITSNITDFITDKSKWKEFIHDNIVSSINFCFNSDYFVSGCIDGKIYIWNILDTTRYLIMFDDIIYPIKQVSWSIDKKQILCAANNIVYIYDIFYNGDDDVDTEDPHIFDNLDDPIYIATYPPKLFKKISLFEENISFISWNNTYYFKKIKNLGTNVPPSGTNAPPSGTNAPPPGTNAPPSGTNAPPSGTNAPPPGTNAPIKRKQQISLVGIEDGELKNKQVIEFKIINNELILPAKTGNNNIIIYNELIKGIPIPISIINKIKNERDNTMKIYNAIVNEDASFEKLDIIFFVKMSSPKQVIKLSDGRELKTGFNYLFKKGTKEQIELKQKTEQGGNITYTLKNPTNSKYDIKVINGWLGNTFVINNVDDDGKDVTYSAIVEPYYTQYLGFTQEFIVKMKSTNREEDLMVESNIPVSGMVGGNTDLTDNAGPIDMVNGIAGLTNDNTGPTGMVDLVIGNIDLAGGPTGMVDLVIGNIDLAGGPTGPTGMVDLVIGNIDLASGPTGPTGNTSFAGGNIDLAGGTTGPTGSTGNAENKYKTIKYSDRFIVCSVNGSIKIVKKLNTIEKTSLLINKQYQKMETILKTKIKINKTLDLLKEILYKK